MGEIHQHPEAVHLAHDVFTEWSQTMMLCFVTGGISPIRILHMRQRHVARAEAIHHAQRAEGVIDRVPTLHADERGNLSFAMDTLDIIRRERELKRLGITRAHAMDAVNLLNRCLHRFRAGNFCRHIDRPKLSAHTAGTQPRNVRVHGWGESRRIVSQVERGEIIAVLAILPRHIVMTVNQRNLPQDTPHFVKIAIRRRSGGS